MLLTMHQLSKRNILQPDSDLCVSWNQTLSSIFCSVVVRWIGYEKHVMAGGGKHWFCGSVEAHFWQHKQGECIFKRCGVYYGLQLL